MVMHNSSSSYKPRSSKLVKPVEADEAKTAEERGDGGAGGSNFKGEMKSIPTIVICPREPRNDSRGEPRPERTRGRSGRAREDGRNRGGGPERRGIGGRGRGGLRRGDRDIDPPFASRAKFQESISRSLSSSLKHANDLEKNRLEVGCFLLPEDCRISKLLRRLCQEDDIDKFFTIAKQLQEALLLPDNGRYIRRSLDYITETLLDVLHSGPASEARAEAAKCLGVAGVALEHDAKRLLDWVFSNYQRERSDEVRVLLMKALQHLLQQDAEHPRLKDFSHGVMGQLQQALESTDKPDQLKATVNVILVLTKTYPNTFNKYFRDTVDILVGWHIDTSQPSSITQFASQALQDLHSYWVADVAFSLNLLSQFLEDMEAYSEDLINPVSGRSSPGEESAPSAEDSLQRIVSIIQVFSTVTRSLGAELAPHEGSPVKFPFLCKSLERLVTTFLATSEHSAFTDCILLAVNEGACLLLDVLQSKASVDSLNSLIERELQLSSTLTIEGYISLLNLTSKMVRECSANLPESLIHHLLGPDSPLIQLRCSTDSVLLSQAVLGVYHSLLSLKNIPLLQETYRYVLQDLARAYCHLIPNVGQLTNLPAPEGEKEYAPYTSEQAHSVVLFLLHALSDLAKASNSIIGMWALQPSIMELLCVRLLPSEDSLSKLDPYFQYTLMYNNFVSSTGLVTSSRTSRISGLPSGLEMSSTSSPTSGHLSLVLNLITNILEKPMICEDCQLLGLRWTQELLHNAKSCLGSLVISPSFKLLVHAVARAGHTIKPAMSSAVASCLHTLLSLLPKMDQQEILMKECASLCLLHLNSPYQIVCSKYRELLLLLSWSELPQLIVLAQSDDEKFGERTSSKFNLEIIRKMSKIHTVRSDCGEMETQHFSRFMAYLLQGVQYTDNDWLAQLLSCCLPPHFLGSSEEISGLGCPAWLRQATQGSEAAQFKWAAWQAAQLCINCKLRTPLGKPQDTFTSIEGSIKSLAREINSEDSLSSEPPPPVNELRRARLLLEFLEMLEKSIYSAAEGCAVAIISPIKAVRTFFHTNKGVCGEWVSRVRCATLLVSCHAALPGSSVRHGCQLLQDLVDQSNTQGPEFDRAAVQVASAMVTLQESEALHGLYAWCRDKAGRRFPWLRVASLQAASRYEEAIVEYQKLLPNDDSLDVNVTGFICDQLSECMRLMGDWTSLNDWRESNSELWSNQSSAVLRTISSTLSMQHVKALSDFEQLQDSTQQHPWQNPARPDNVGGAWGSHRVMGRAEEVLVSIILFLTPSRLDSATPELQPQTKSAMLEESLGSLNHLQDLLQEGLRSDPAQFCAEALVQTLVAQALVLHLQDSPGISPLFMSSSEIKYMGSSLLNKVVWWAGMLQQISEAKNISTSSLTQLRLAASRTARKEGNTLLSVRFLASFWEEEHKLANMPLKTSSNGYYSSRHALGDRIAALTTLEPGVWVRWGRGAALKETAKLLFDLERPAAATDMLARSALCAVKLVAEGTSCLDTVSKDPVNFQETASGLLLSLTKKLTKAQPNGELSSLVNRLTLDPMPSSPLSDLLDWGRNVSDTRLLKEWDIQLPEIAEDACNQQLLQLALTSSPRSPKPWSQFAAWSYRRGRRCSDAEEEGAGVHVTQDDLGRLAEILGPDLMLQEVVLHQFRQPWPDEVSLAQALGEVLPPGDCLEQVVALWGQRSQSHNFYRAAATAYFRFLTLSGAEECQAEATLTATLRLLRLIVKHAAPLQEVLETGLALTPTNPWKGIIPQLFARLSHPELYVRRRLSELLCRIATDAPHLILFPAVVGCSSSKTPPPQKSELYSYMQEEDGDEAEEEEEEEDSNSLEESQTSVLRSCFLAMVDTLSLQAPNSTAQVRLLVSELRRITLLWDELWLGCLVQHHTDVTRRLSQLDSELKRLEENESLSSTLRSQLAREKYRIIMKPVVLVFEQLQTITSVPPETPHEQAFQEKFSEMITSALASLREPPQDKPISPQACWQPFRQLQGKLQQRAQRRGAHSLKLSDISPALAALKDSAIAMPGLEQGHTLVTIASMDDLVSVLPTKTRPKKLSLQGSDGRTYTFLFKGLEDLHLDERIMQFLSITNTMLAGSGRHTFRARHYSVVPLGARSGLISWVDGVQPMFGLYKRWQQRDAASQQLRGPTQGPTPVPAPVLRPSELFYSRLAPLLKERGLAVENRKDWPLTVLRQVLVSLMNDTPRDLLAKELWCTSSSAAAWWQVTTTYSRSVAVMSVIGYVIGLGDRHLDNLLINLVTGEVVHIDYNVCFEKGHTLRVPEKVPFRLTPNLQAALGVTGVEGVFRLSCEHVLRVMKRGRETLLTLLEAFVYDPLVDWTPGSEAGYTGAVYGGQSQSVAAESRPSRKELEREAAQAMLAVRVTEMRAAWCDNRSRLEGATAHLGSEVRKWLEVQVEVARAQEALQDAHQQLSLLKEAEASNGAHVLFSLHQRYAAHVRRQQARGQAVAALQERHKQASQMHARLQAALAAVRGPELPSWASEIALNPSLDDGGRELFDLVQEFLASSGKTSIINQCEQSEAECSRLLVQQRVVLRACIEVLGQFHIMAALFPPMDLECRHTLAQARLSEELLQNLTSERCRVAAAHMQNLSREPTLACREQAAQYQTQVQLALVQGEARLQTAYKRLRVEGPEDPTPQLEVALVLARAQVNSLISQPALMASVLQALGNLNSQLLSLEAAADNTGESLVDLTLRGGEWFLDKMLLFSGLMAELASVLLPQGDKTNVGQIGAALHCLQASHGVYKGLQDLMWNVGTIIIPESLASLNTQQPSVLTMVQGLGELGALLGGPLAKVHAEVEDNLRYLTIDLPPPHPEHHKTCQMLRVRLDQLLCQGSISGVGCLEEQKPLTPGQMLLMGFNGLFDRLQLEASTLVASLAALSVPASWGKLDQLHKARTLSWSIQKEGSQQIIEDFFFIGRIKVMQEVFGLCSQSAQAFAGLRTYEEGDRVIGSFLSEDQLLQPVRRFVADFVRHQLLGLQPQAVSLAICVGLEELQGVDLTEHVEREVGAESRVSLEEVCRLAARGCEESRLSHASTALGALETAWRHREGAAHAQREAEAAQGSLQRMQMTVAAHGWLKDFPHCGRPMLVMELRKAVTSLMSLQSCMAEASEQQLVLVASITQRLKWAAGANPTLNEVLSAFNILAISREERMQQMQHLSAQILSAATSILHLEALRNNTSESASYNAGFIQLLCQCEQSLALLESSSGLVLHPAEESLVLLAPPEQPVDLSWIRSTEGIVSGRLQQLASSLGSQETLLSSALDDVQAAASEVRAVLTLHHGLVGGVRSLLKALAKPGEGREVLEAYLARYRCFSEQFSALVRSLSSDELDQARAESALEQVNNLNQLIGGIFEDLLGLAERCSRVGGEVVPSGPRPRPPLLRQESVCLSPHRGVPNVKPVPQTTKIPQEKNAYALSVWRRVRAKLDGRDPDPNKKASVPEQVEYIVSEATNLDNLCLLYEGWTPWV